MPVLQALGSTRLVQRWITALLEPSLISSISDSKSVAYNSSDLLIESASGLAITTATTITAATAATTNGSAFVATASAPVVAGGANLSSSLTGAGDMSRIKLIWNQPDLAPGCTQVFQSLLDEVLASSPSSASTSETSPESGSGSGSGSDALSLPEQIRHLQPRVMAHIDRHPECFHSEDRHDPCQWLWGHESTSTDSSTSSWSESSRLFVVGCSRYHKRSVRRRPVALLRKLR